MENQHKHIIGYRDLSKRDVDGMNLLKEAGRAMLHVIECMEGEIKAQRKACHAIEDEGLRSAEQNRMDAAQPERWLALARTHQQMATMFMVRALAQPTDC